MQVTEQVDRYIYIYMKTIFNLNYVNLIIIKEIKVVFAKLCKKYRIMNLYNL